jgi:hypothetical protein
VLVGLALYAISPKVQFSATMSNGMLRFYTIEHTVMMLIAVILITIGHRSEILKFQKNWYYLIALAIILVIPWPFRAILEEYGSITLAQINSSCEDFLKCSYTQAHQS